MGGVDLADMLIALYRTKIMVEKRWHLQVIFHALDICKIKGWLLYCRYCHEQAVPKTDQKSLLAFISELVGALKLAGKSVARAKNQSLSPTPSVGKKAVVATPFPDVRYDLHDHRF